MIFKIEVLEKNIHIVRGYRKKDDIPFCFSCVLHRKKKWYNPLFIFSKTPWHMLIAMSSGMCGKSILEATRYLKNYPNGTYTYVSKKDFDRFYKRFCKLIKFDDCDF